MKTSVCTLYSVWALILAPHFLSDACRAQGIPEPTMILYGVVTDPLEGGIRLSFGPIVWVLRPSDGSPAITITGVLTNINDQFSYVLRIPCETVLPGVPVSAGTLKLSSTPITYNRSQVTVSGVPATFAVPSLTNLTLTSTDRGRIERVDLMVDLDLSGLLPVAWQMQYFGRTGIEPFDDADGDGMSNYAEFIAGTNPTDPQSLFQFVRVTPDPTAGVTVEWSGIAGKLYTLQRSTDLLNGFEVVSSGIVGTAPTTVFKDATAVGRGSFFYRVRVE